jgi:signal transduction histidine kinase
MDLAPSRSCGAPRDLVQDDVHAALRYTPWAGARPVENRGRKLELSPQTVQLAPLINEVIGTAGQLAEKNKNRLIVEAQENAGALNADPMRLKQILLNLLSNACKFTKEGEVALRVRKVADGRVWVELAVADSGIGMTAEQQNCSRISPRPIHSQHGAMAGRDSALPSPASSRA